MIGISNVKSREDLVMSNVASPAHQVMTTSASGSLAISSDPFGAAPFDPERLRRIKERQELMKLQQQDQLQPQQHREHNYENLVTINNFHNNSVSQQQQHQQHAFNPGNLSFWN